MGTDNGTLYDVIAIGNISCDIIFSALPTAPRPGAEVNAGRLQVALGGTFNVAAAATRLNLHTGAAAVLGTDLFSRFIGESCREEGVDQSLFLHTTAPHEQVSAVTSFGDEQMITSYAPPGGLLLGHVEDITRSHRARVCVFGIQDQPVWQDHMRRMRDKGAYVLLDCNSDVLAQQSPYLAGQIAACDVFVPNQAEALALTGEGDPEKAALALASHGCDVVVKCGSQGAVSCHGGAVRRHPAYRFGPVLDATGAGDNFAAGFAYGVCKGRPFAECVRYGLLCGSKSVVAVGGCTASLYESELQYLLGAPPPTEGEEPV